ncbi:P-loop containing nucleoside triphosphate hydrolase protein [Scheffersomyces xylosifermentans]|uniref:P-loop containing nucleoside triphosphate hydrolase protein n=1 Tax=Scheffersomyces xylosifermentans TaxID=1304137 RepID=UPI00315CA9A3
MKPSKLLLQEACLLRIKNALFKRDTGTSSPSIFSQPIGSFEIYEPNNSNKPSFWSVSGPAKSQFLSMVSGKYLPVPPLSRSYPFLSENFQYSKIQFLNFKENSGLDRVHLSARYETYAYKGVLEMTDDVNSVKNYITGANNYNKDTGDITSEYVDTLLQLFNLDHLSHKWINSLSNGQLRRARIAKSLVSQPTLLIIDDPFLGLDPRATELVSNSLERVSKDLGTSIVLGLRVQDQIPKWIDSIAYVDESGLKLSGDKETTLPQLHEVTKAIDNVHSDHQNRHLKHQNPVEIDNDKLMEGLSVPPHIEFHGASVAYKGLTIFSNFNWKIPRGTKWRILGDNGTGKTTLLSIITADHPQSWKSVLRINGVERKTGNGVTFFDVNNRIGISSPELHALVPQHTQTMKQIILNGLVKDVGNSNFMFKGKEEDLGEFGTKILSLFSDRLEACGNTKFTDLSITDQKLTLFLRAIVKNPHLLILDEAFSCMDDESIMIRCHDVIEKELKDTTVLAIGHIDWEVPKCDYLLKLYGDKDRNYGIFKYT